jgi:hypothetical protein
MDRAEVRETQRDSFDRATFPFDHGGITSLVDQSQVPISIETDFVHSNLLLCEQHTFRQITEQANGIAASRVRCEDPYLHLNQNDPLGRLDDGVALSWLAANGVAPRLPGYGDSLGV